MGFCEDWVVEGIFCSVLRRVLLRPMGKMSDKAVGSGAR